MASVPLSIGGFSVVSTSCLSLHSGRFTLWGGGGKSWRAQGFSSCFESRSIERRRDYGLTSVFQQLDCPLNQNSLTSHILETNEAMGVIERHYVLP